MFVFLCGFAVVPGGEEAEGGLVKELTREQEATWSWNVDVAREYLFYSYATYCPKSSITSWSCKWCEEAPVKAFQPVAFPFDRRVQGSGFIGINNANKTSKLTLSYTSEG